MSHKAFLIVAFLLIAFRFCHFGNVIEDPHAWRQCDTANYIYDFHKNGIDLLNPSVCWMGAHKTVILELPLPEAFVAVLFDLFGEHNWLARLFFLACFNGAAFCFFKIIQRIFDDELAKCATLIYLALPLSLFYSRAIHIDFFAVFMAHGMVLFWIKAIESQKTSDWLVGLLFAIPAFLVKAPYVFYFALPMVFFVFKMDKFRSTLKWLPLVIIPLVVFYFWQKYVHLVNGLAPDWDYIPHYRKFDDNARWYFGALEHRFYMSSWTILVKRFLFEICGIGGAIVGLVGFFSFKKQIHRYFAYTWLAGVVIYLLIFFNLNVIHNYYQIPFLAPAALFISCGILTLSGNADKWVSGFGKPVGVVLFAIIVTGNIFFSERNYFVKEPSVALHKAGAIIRENTKENALPVITYNGFDCRNPQALYRARRNGWSIQEDGWKAEILTRLQKEEGATHFVFISAQPPKGEMMAFCNRLTDIGIFQLENSELTVFIWELQ